MKTLDPRDLETAEYLISWMTKGMRGSVHLPDRYIFKGDFIFQIAARKSYNSEEKVTIVITYPWDGKFYFNLVNLIAAIEEEKIEMLIGACPYDNSENFTKEARDFHKAITFNLIELSRTRAKRRREKDTDGPLQEFINEIEELLGF